MKTATLRTSKMNNPTITQEQLIGCYCGDHLFIPMNFFNSETGELTESGDCVLRFSGLNDTEVNFIDDLPHFFKTLEFAANVGIGVDEGESGLTGLSEHLQINGYSIKVTGVLLREDFLKREGEFGYEDVDFNLFKSN